MRVRILTSSLLCFLLIFSSCKNDSKETQTTTPEKTEFSKLSEEEKKDFNTSVWAKMASLGTTSTFTRSAVSAGLPDVLMNTKDITVFAPSVEAFEALTTSEKEIIQNPSNVEALKTLLKSHIISENLSSVAMVSRLKESSDLELETLTGTKIQVVKDDMDLFLVTERGDTTKIVMSDIQASNGHIHVVDKVFLPK